MMTRRALAALFGSLGFASAQSTSALEQLGKPAGAVPPLALFVDQETPVGAVDGYNAAFAVSAVPKPLQSLYVWRNGMLLKLGLDYALNGNTISFLTGAVPQAGDTLLVTFRK